MLGMVHRRLPASIRGGFDFADVRDIVAGMLADAFGAPPDEDLAVLAATAAGNPSLLTGLISGLREEHAIQLGGSSVSDYVDADGVRGFFQLEHRVYMRGGQPCLVCGTPIRRTVLGGRGTHYCPTCQK